MSQFDPIAYPHHEDELSGHMLTLSHFITLRISAL
jgi:hypothetical protein